MTKEAAFFLDFSECSALVAGAVEREQQQGPTNSPLDPLFSDQEIALARLAELVVEYARANNLRLSEARAVIQQRGGVAASLTGDQISEQPTRELLS